MTPNPERITYQSKRFDESLIAHRYARVHSNDEVKIFDVAENKKTIREWWCMFDELPIEWQNQLDRNKYGMCFDQQKLDNTVNM